jgi:hypothetical protein
VQKPIGRKDRRWKWGAYRDRHVEIYSQIPSKGIGFEFAFINVYMTKYLSAKENISPAVRVGCAVVAGTLLVTGIRRVQRPGVFTSLLLGTAVYLAWDAFTGIDPMLIRPH